MFCPHQDVSAFEALAMSAFPGERSSRGDNLNMIKTVRQVLADKPDIHVSTQVIRNVVQLYDIMDMQTGVMLLGHPGCGKTTLRDIVAMTLKELAKQQVLQRPNLLDALKVRSSLSSWILKECVRCRNKNWRSRRLHCILVL